MLVVSERTIMDVRQGNISDADDIERVARASLTESYTGFLDEETIETALSTWYGHDALESRLTGSEETFVVVSVDDSVVAFSQSSLVGQSPAAGEIRWLHVHPDYRGRGIAADLLSRTEEVLVGQGADLLVGLVLEDNDAGRAFYERQGFDPAGERPVEIGAETFTEYTYEYGKDDAVPTGAGERVATVDGEEVTVVVEEANRGRLAPFHPAYRSEGRETPYTWFCGNCESFDTAMDAMGRLECNECGNTRKPARWDAAYL